MIKCQHIENEFCDNCGRKMPVIVRYALKSKMHNMKLDLCEDCSNALSTLHFKVIEKEKTYLYHEDTFFEEDKQIEV